MNEPGRAVGREFEPPRLHGPLASPADLRAAVGRGKVLSEEHGHLFHHATPTETVRALFAGWTLCGTRASVRRDRHTFVLRRDCQWFGFDFFASVTEPTPPTKPEQSIDHVHLIRRSRELPVWGSLAGADRLRRVSNAMRLHGKDAPVTADGPVAFLREMAERCNRLPPGGDLGHYRLMVEIVLTEDITDSDGELASARMLAGLGTFAFPPNIPTRIHTIPGLPSNVLSRPAEC